MRICVQNEVNKQAENRHGDVRRAREFAGVSKKFEQ
jgi:hypothetical protein